MTSLDHVYSNEGNLLLEIEGVLYPILNLQKLNESWLVTLDVDPGHCGRGHCNCPNCFQCHTPGCRYFVKFCNRWK